MATVTFDTLKFVRKLKEAGFEQNQAEAVADAFRDAQAETEVATTRDLKELELSLKAEIKEMELSLKAEMQAMEYRMTIKLGGMMAASVVIVAALVRLL
ncbi:DUF1640 domain-containing protein [Crenothrix sp.]|uniref:DUF1640 domain-containing protein n=1 Tax=Crenothrix sp. TaxID=3100433 RepID=UPI00374DDC4C